MMHSFVMFIAWGIIAVLWFMAEKYDMAALAFGIGTLWVKK